MSKVVFKGAFLINGTKGLPIEDSVVIVEDKKIIYAGKATKVLKGLHKNENELPENSEYVLYYFTFIYCYFMWKNQR